MRDAHYSASLFQDRRRGSATLMALICITRMGRRNRRKESDSGSALHVCVRPTTVIQLRRFLKPFVKALAGKYVASIDLRLRQQLDTEDLNNEDLTQAPRSRRDARASFPRLPLRPAAKSSFN